jgi:hypothetical protein
MTLNQLIPLVSIGRGLSRHDQAGHGEVVEALLALQSPTASVIGQRMPASSRMTIWIIAAAVLLAITIISVYPVDRVVAVPGRVVARTANIVVQPLDTAIVRSINVEEGQRVHAGGLIRLLQLLMPRAWRRKSAACKPKSIAFKPSNKAASISQTAAR